MTNRVRRRHAPVARHELVAGHLSRSMPVQTLLKSAHDSEPPSVNNWILTLIDFGDRRGRKSSATVIASLILFIGLIGYTVGIRFSLYAFYLVPVILSALWFGWQWGCAVS